MPVITRRQAVWAAALIACVVYAGALRNGWAGDDPLIIPRNMRAHTLTAAMDAWFKPYWPPPWQGAGLYRPFTILSYAAEWTMAQGSPWLFHLDNILLHGTVTALVVALLLAWLPPLGAFMAGAVFALHPVHVEAVANVVGRAELLATAAILGAMLLARRFRHVAGDREARFSLLACAAVVAVGVFSKENAAIAVAAIAVDHVLDPKPQRRSSWNLYVAVTWVTAGWFYLWHAIAGRYVASGATSAFFGLSRAQQISTMMPALLDVLRLLAWPMVLSSDYSAQTIPIRLQWGPLAWMGLISSGALLALGLLCNRRAPAITFGILIAVGSYLPTSNLLFTSGVVLAERALYLGVLAPAVAVGCVFALLEQRRITLRPAIVGIAVILLGFAARTVERVPYWKSPTDTIIDDVVEHPENYRARLHLADLFASRRDTARALAEYLSSAALAPHDPFMGEFIMRSAVALKRPALAIDEGRRIHKVAPDDPRTGGWLAETYVAAGKPDSAVTLALSDALRHPTELGFVRTYSWSLERAHAPAWRTLLARGSGDWLSGQYVQASARLDSAFARLPQTEAPSFCSDLQIARLALRQLKPDLLRGISGDSTGEVARCRDAGVPR